MSTYTLKSLGNDFMEDSSMQQEPSDHPAEDRSSFKLVGLKEQNSTKQSIARISHKRHDPSARVDTKSRVMGCDTPSGPHAEKSVERAGAGQRMDENREPTARQHNDSEANHRNPITGQGQPHAEKEKTVGRVAAGERMDDEREPTARRHNDSEANHRNPVTGQGQHHAEKACAGRAAAGERMDGDKEPATRLPNETWANRRNPVTGQEQQPAEKEETVGRAAAGERMDGYKEPATRLPNPTWANRRNPVTGQGLTPVEQVHGGRTHNMRNKSSITFITSPD